jgi:hydrogenase maturation protease
MEEADRLKTLVLGLGNPLLTDDGAGIYAVRAAVTRCRTLGPVDQQVTFAEASLGGLRLLDVIAGYDRAVLVDAILTADGKPGTVYRLQPSDLRRSLHSGTTHDLSLTEALALGRTLGLKLPDDGQITILAIEVDDVRTFGQACTPSVTQAIPTVAEMICTEIVSGLRSSQANQPIDKDGERQTRHQSNPRRRR